MSANWFCSICQLQRENRNSVKTVEKLVFLAVISSLFLRGSYSISEELVFLKIAGVCCKSDFKI